MYYTRIPSLGKTGTDCVECVSVKVASWDAAVAVDEEKTSKRDYLKMRYPLFFSEINFT